MPTSRSTSPWQVIRASRLIDGTGAASVQDPVVVIHGETIHAVYAGIRTNDLVAAVPNLPRATPVLDLMDHTLLPGLIDAHVHMVLPGDGTPFETIVQEPDGVLVAIAHANALTALRAGITTLRDCGGRLNTTLELRRAQRLRYARLPRLHLCGRPITITGGHCWYFGGEADGPDGLRRMVRMLLKGGVDYIKIMATGGGTVGTMPWLPSFSEGEIRAVVDEAHRLGLRVGIHSLCAEATRYAIATGADQIEHCGFLADETGRREFDPRIAEAVARAGIPVTTTLAVGRYVVSSLEATGRPSPEEQVQLDRWRRMFEHNLADFRQLHRAGVQLVAGTDAGWRFTPFNALATEVGLLCEVGVGAMEAIAAATSVAARAMGLGGQTGILRKGMSADLIAVPGDPAADLRVLHHPSMVMLNGAVVHGPSQFLGSDTGC